MGYQLGNTALNYKDDYNAFRIRCIMLIVEKVNYLSMSQKHYMKP